MQADRLTPAQLRDLATVFDRAMPWVTGHTYGALSNMRAICNSEAARREAEAKPQNGRGHIPLITCPGSTKSCMGYDCLDKGCLDGEPMASGGVSVPELRNSNISLGGCEVCTTPTACKQEKHCDHFDCEWTRAVPDDELGRASGETGPSPSPVTTGLPPQGEREGPGSAAAPDGYAVGPMTMKRPVGSNADDWAVFIEYWCGPIKALSFLAVQIAEAIDDAGKGKPAPADDLVKRLRGAITKSNGVDASAGLVGYAADFVEALTARVRELEAELAAERDSRQIAQDTCDMQKARADRLAANKAVLIEALKLCRELADHIAKAPLPLFRAQATKVRECIDAALTEGGA